MKRELLWVEDILLEREGLGRLHHLDLSIGMGEALGVIGLSGSGKSALAEILCGMCLPDSGSFRQAGQAISREALERMSLHISCGSQLLPNLSVTENLLVLGRPLGRDGGRTCPSRIQRSFCRELLEEFDLAQYLEIPPGRLPLSVQHCLLMVGALVRQKQLVVLDHATDNYTDQEQALLGMCIHRLCRRGVTVVWLTGHIAPLLWEMDRVTVVRDGRRVKELKRNTFTETALRTYMYGYRAVETNMIGRSLGETALCFDHLEIREGELVPVYDPDGTARQFCARIAALNAYRSDILTSESLTESWIGSFSVLENLLLPIAPQVSIGVGYIPRSFQRTLRDKCITATGLTEEQVEGPFSRLNRMERFQTLLFREQMQMPELWVLDRITAGADLQDREMMRQSVCSLPGIIFYLSGDYSELTSFGTRIFTLDGSILREETL